MLLKSRGILLAALPVFGAGVALGIIWQNVLEPGRTWRQTGFTAPPASISDSALDAAAYQNAKGRLRIFILAGQSNMSGRGSLDAWRQRTNARIWALGNDGRWKTATEPLDDARAQVDQVSADPAAGVSPGVAFAERLLEKHPDWFVGLVPCAMGGSSITMWQRDVSDRTLYGSCLKRAQAAKPMGALAGLLFYQGEAEAFAQALPPNQPPAAHEWKKHFVGLVEQFRLDVKETALPVVFAQLATTTDTTRIHWETVKAAQASVAMATVAMITTEDLELADHAHFTTAGYETLGKRFADAYLSLMAPQPPAAR